MNTLNKSDSVNHCRSKSTMLTGKENIGVGESHQSKKWNTKTLTSKSNEITKKKSQKQARKNLWNSIEIKILQLMLNEH